MHSYAPALALLVGVCLLARCSADPGGPYGIGSQDLTSGPAGGTAVPPAGAIRPGALVPDFQLADLTGQPVTVASLRGQVVWINFWATWCPSCKTEMPRMAQKYQQYRDQGLVILSLDLQESPETVRAGAQGQFS